MIDAIPTEVFSEFRDLVRRGEFEKIQTRVRALRSSVSSFSIEVLVLTSILVGPRRGVWALRVIRLLEEDGGASLSDERVQFMIEQAHAFEIPVEDLRTLLGERPRLIGRLNPDLLVRCYLMGATGHVRCLVEAGMVTTAPLRSFIYVTPIFGLSEERSKWVLLRPSQRQAMRPVGEVLFEEREALSQASDGACSSNFEKLRSCCGSESF